jgi:hypothetical protein
MNEKELEERLRSVVDGPKPSAPPSLRAFLREMPEPAARRSRVPAWLGGMAGGLRGLFAPAPAVRCARFAFAVSIAVVFGLVGGGLLMSVRQHAAPATTPFPNNVTTSAPPTPRRSLASVWPPNKFVLNHITSFQWSGILSTDDGNDKQAMPVSAVALKSGGYVGVSTDEFGKNGLVFSSDGIYWNWDPPSEVDPAGVVLSSIATNGKGQLVLAGAAVGHDGSKDGRIYTSTDGHKWTAVADATQLFGGTAIRTVVYGLAGYVALGWNDTDTASRTVREWLSTDGIHWNVMSGVPIAGAGGFILPTQSGYLLSGMAQAKGVEQPIWYSSDGHTWLQSRWKSSDGMNLIAVGPILSATIAASGSILAIVPAADGSGTKVFEGTYDAMDWHAVNMAGAPELMSIASIDGAGGRLLVAVGMAQDGHVYVSTDEVVKASDTVNWSIASNLSTFPGAPTGQALLQLGVNYQGTSAKVLCYGHPDYMMGIWLGAATGG